MPYLPNGAAQRATIHGMGDPTHRRSYGGILVTKLQNSWLRPLGNSLTFSVKSFSVTVNGVTSSLFTNSTADCFDLRTRKKAGPRFLLRFVLCFHFWNVKN